MPHTLREMSSSNGYVLRQYMDVCGHESAFLETNIDHKTHLTLCTVGEVFSFKELSIDLCKALVEHYSRSLPTVLNLLDLREESITDTCFAHATYTARNV